MSMKSIKSTTKKPSTSAEVASSSSAEPYPYGMTLSMNQDTLAKLGIKTLPEVGSSLMMEIKVTVTSVSSRSGSDGQERSMELQVTDVDMETDDKEEVAEGEMTRDESGPMSRLAKRMKGM